MGHYISADINLALETEWDIKHVKLTKLERTLVSWRKRNLTIFGKITVLKSLALSQIINSAIVDYIPENFLKRLNKIVNEFIWNSSTEKV